MLSPSSLPDVSVSNVVYHLVIAGTGLRNWRFLLVLTALPPDASTIPWSCGEMGEVSSPLKLRKGGDALGPRQCVLNLRASPGPIVSRWGPPTLARNDGSQGVQVCVLEWGERSHGRGEEGGHSQSRPQGARALPTVRHSAKEHTVPREVPSPNSGGHGGSSAFTGQKP